MAFIERDFGGSALMARRKFPHKFSAAPRLCVRIYYLEFTFR